MTASSALLLLAVLLDNRALSRAWLLPNETDCPSETLIDVTSAHFQPNGSTISNGVFYPADAIEYVLDRSSVALDGVYYSVNNKNSTDSYHVMVCPCRARICLSLCCDKGNCTQPIDSSNDRGFFPIHDAKTYQVNVNASVADFWQIAWDPCHGTESYPLMPEVRIQDRFKLLSDGRLQQSKDLTSFKNYTNFCVRSVQNKWRIMLCKEDPSEVKRNKPLPAILLVATMLISVPFLIATFLVYMLIEELRNIHGLTVCAYILCLIIGYLSFAILKSIYRGERVPYLACSIHGICLLKIF